MSKSPEEQHFYDQVWAFWTPRGAEYPPCILCWEEAVTLHEIQPRSTTTDWLDRPFNSVPICARCHDEVELDPAVAGVKLSSLATDRAHQVVDWRGEDYDRVIRELYSEEKK